MPYSSFIFDKSIEEIIRLLKPQIFLDLGAGAGKYGELVKKISPSTKLTAVEIQRDYIKKFRLPSIYNEVWNISVTDLINPKYYDSNFDVIMIGDIIEHLKKSDGIDLLNFLIYRCRWIILEFPHHYLQNSVDGYHSEAHISVWTKDDFVSFERTQLYEKDTQRLVVLRGYLENKTSVADVESVISEHE